jgi:hypothetical protein
LREDTGGESIVEQIERGQTKQDRTIEKWCQFRGEDLGKRRAGVFSGIGRETKLARQKQAGCPKRNQDDACRSG